MRKKIMLWTREEYSFPGAGEFLPFLMAELHEDEKERPAMLVVPGGGFILESSGEADAVADKFFNLGYNTFVLVYTNNVTLDKPMIGQAMRDASRAVRLIRAEQETLHIDPDRITAVGFSGGGHMVASLATIYDLPELQDDEKYGGVSNRLNAAVPVYALVTGGKYTCPGAYDRLLGESASEEERKLHSLELQVKDNSVPMYILHGTADLMVPAQNAIMLAEACAEHNVPYELHLLLGCNHGFAVADFDAKFTWSSRYVFEQLYETIHAMSAEEFDGYQNVLGDLKQNMNYDEFARVVQESTMAKLWFAGLQVDLAKIQEAVASTSGNTSFAIQKNPNADGWWLSVDRWLQMIL